MWFIRLCSSPLRLTGEESRLHNPRRRGRQHCHHAAEHRPRHFVLTKVVCSHVCPYKYVGALLLKCNNENNSEVLLGGIIHMPNAPQSVERDVFSLHRI